MTETSRAQQILRSLEQQQAGDGPKETLTVPLQRHSEVLPVITLPLSVPVLNAKELPDRAEACGSPVGRPRSA